MSIINYFSNKRYSLYKRDVKIDKSSGASIVEWNFDKNVLGYYEPAETLIGTEAGNKYGITGVFYSEQKLIPSDRIDIEGNRFEIREVEFWQAVGLRYYKGYLVKIDENI